MAGWWRKHINSRDHFDGMRAFYLNALLRALVFSLVGIFIPIFIYKTTLPVFGTHQSALISVAAYLLIIRSISFVFSIPISRIIEKIGFRYSVLVSAIFIDIFLIALYKANSDWRYLVIAAVAVGFNVPFYWISRHSTIVIDSKDDVVGRQVGFLSVLERVSGMLGPLAGGLIIEMWGFRILYMIALVISVVSVVPLFSMPHHVHHNGVSLRGLFHWITDRGFFHQAIASVGRAMDDYSANLLWPLTISFMASGLVVVGGVFSFLSMISVIVRYVTGIVFDKLYRKGGNEDEWLFGIATVANSLLWIGRTLVTSIKQVVILDGTLGIFGTTYRNVSDGYVYLGGKRMSEIAYNTYREVMMSFSLVVLILLMIVGVFFGIWKELTFLFTSLWVLASIVQARESDLH